MLKRYGQYNNWPKECNVFLFTFHENGAICSLLLGPNVILACVEMDACGNLNFLNQTFLSKNYPHPLKLEAMSSIFIIFKQISIC